MNASICMTAYCLFALNLLTPFIPPFFLFMLSYELAECFTMLYSDISASELSTCYTSLCSGNWTSTPLLTVEKIYCVYVWRRGNLGASLLFILVFCSFFFSFMYPLIVVTIIFLLCDKKSSSTKRYISYLLQHLILQLYLFYNFCVLNTKCPLHSLFSDPFSPLRFGQSHIYTHFHWTSFSLASW